MAEHAYRLPEISARREDLPVVERHWSGERNKYVVAVAYLENGEPEMCGPGFDCIAVDEHVERMFTAAPRIVHGGREDGPVERHPKLEKRKDDSSILLQDSFGFL